MPSLQDDLGCRLGWLTINILGEFPRTNWREGNSGYTACTLQLIQGTCRVLCIYPVLTVMVYSRLQGILHLPCSDFAVLYSMPQGIPAQNLIVLAVYMQCTPHNVHCRYTECPHAAEMGALREAARDNILC